MAIRKALPKLIAAAGFIAVITGLLLIGKNGDTVVPKPNITEASNSPEQTVVDYWRYAEAGLIAEAEKLRVPNGVDGVWIQSSLPPTSETIRFTGRHLVSVKVLENDGTRAVVRGTAQKNDRGGVSFIHRLVWLGGKWRIEGIHF